MRRLTLFLGAVLCFSATVSAQSRQSYDGFYIELNRRGKAVALFFRETDGVGCSPKTSANGTVGAVDWDVVVTKFTVRFKTGRLSFFTPDSLNEISNVDRGLLPDIFSKGKRVKVTWRECGSGNIPEVIGISVLR